MDGGLSPKTVICVLDGVEARRKRAVLRPIPAVPPTMRMDWGLGGMAVSTTGGGGGGFRTFDYGCCLEMVLLEQGR